MSDRYLETYALHEREDAGSVEVVPAGQFAAVEEPGADVLLGTATDNLLPVGADAMLYGDGGAGKTTLAIDMACHLAAGREWLGIPVPRPVRVLLMENEGPRPLFRLKLRRKLAAWEPVPEPLWVWEQPWSGFQFSDEEMRGQLSRIIHKHEIDLVIAGPVVRLGMLDAGTMPEVRAFAALVDLVRERSLRPVSFLLVHHENKGGRVSGAWEGVGDTLFHVQGGGHGKTRLFIQKARWGAKYHGVTLRLAWAAGEGFAFAEEDAQSRAERVWDEIETYVKEHPGTSWNEIRKAVSGDDKFKVLRRDAMADEGVIVNCGTEHRSAYWHRDDPAKPEPLEGVEWNDTTATPAWESTPPATPPSEVESHPTIHPTLGDSAGRDSESGWGGGVAVNTTPPVFTPPRRPDDEEVEW